MNSIPPVKADLTGAQRALLAARLKGRGKTAESIADRIPPRGPGSPPLSFSQQRLWFVDQFEEQGAQYHVPLILRASGVLDIPALSHALAQLVRRHEILRSCFPTHQGEPCQVVLPPPASIAIAETDLTATPDAWPEASAREIRARFDLAHGPLMRSRVLRLDAENTILILNFHHIVIDGWSLGNFVRELIAAYNAARAGKEASLAPLPIQYADYATWQREYLSGAVLERELGYWVGQLKGAERVLELPSDRPRGAIQGIEGANFAFCLPPMLSAQLKALAPQYNVSLFMLLLAAFKVLLYRYTSQDDISVGSAIAGRNRSELEPLIGFFVNTLVLRSRLDGTMRFSDFLAQVRTTTLDAYAHQELPFDKLVEVLQPTRTSSHTPLFQVMFVLQNAPMETLALPGLTLEVLAADTRAAKFDLTLACLETVDGIAGSLEYRTELFDASTIARLSGHFEALLKGIVANVNTPLARLPFITAPERHLTCETWNATQAALPYRQCLHQLFERQVDTRPDAPAIISAHRAFSYAQANHFANRLAHRLRKSGVGPQQVVAIVMEKNIAQVLAVLGIMKAGATYLPISPATPRERLDYLLAISDVRVVLTLSRTDEALAWPVNVERVCLDSENFDEPDTNPALAQTPDDLAYIIFTSGSTGVPKGVMLSHAGVVNTILDTTERYGMGPNDRTLALSQLTFDISVYDIFAPFAVGGAVVVPEYLDSPDPAEWARMVMQHQVTTWFSVPALFEIFIDYAENTPDIVPTSLRRAIIGGDWIPLSLPDRARALIPQITLTSVGGATEVSIFSSDYIIEEVDPAWKSVPYGKPMRNQRFFILNEALEPCPIGVPGELFIGGVGVARGYWRDPERTAESFIEHPLLNERLYKTGDLARYLPDGNVEFLGRRDFQVKINGYRIELGEIEAVLSGYPAVRQAVAHVDEDEGGRRSLVAYIVPLLEPERLLVNMPCVVREDDGSETKLTLADVSLQGANLDFCPVHWTAGQRIHIGLRLEFRDTPTYFASVIMWRHGDEAGVRFDKADSLREIEACIRDKAHASNVETGVLRYKCADIQRLHFRVPLAQPCLGLRDGVETEVELIDISYDGARLRDVPALWQTGEPVRLQVFLPPTLDPLWLWGRIVWRSTNTAGVVFESGARERSVIEEAANYIIHEQGYALSQDNLRRVHQFLADRLPSYMVPLSYRLLYELPLTANGKVDHNALPRDGFWRLERGYIEPRTPMEAELARLWATELKVERVGITDNFFEIGGHSMLAMQLLARVYAAFGAEISVASFFRQPTIEALARHIKAGAPSSMLIPLNQADKGTPLFVVHPAGGQSFWYQALAEHLPYPVIGLESPALHGGSEPDGIQALAEHYVKTLRGRQPHGPYRLGGWSLGGVIAFEMAQQLRIQGETVEWLILFDGTDLNVLKALPSSARAVYRAFFDQAPGINASGEIMSEDAFVALDRPVQAQRTLECLMTLGMLPPGSDATVFLALFDLTESHIAAVQRYQPAFYAGPMVFLQPAEASGNDDMSGYWRALCTGSFDVYTVTGNHQTMLREPNARAMGILLCELAENGP